ncbi:hypothetical protein LguiA_004393 [Lonicera macranthoides]
MYFPSNNKVFKARNLFFIYSTAPSLAEALSTVMLNTLSIPHPVKQTSKVFPISSPL